MILGGQLKQVIAETFPLENIQEALVSLESNQHIGKIIVLP